MKWLRRLIALPFHLLGLAVLLTPPVIFGLWFANGYLEHLDRILTQAAPIVSAEASKFLKRPVQIGGLTPNLTVSRIWDMVTKPGTLHISATDIVVGNKREEMELAGNNPILGSVKRITAEVSLLDLLGEDKTGAVKRVLVESPVVTVVRDPKGEWNLFKLVPKPPRDPHPKPPFGTVIEILSAQVHWRDYASKRGGQLSVNSLSVPSAIVDMSGPRLIRFNVSGAALPGSPTIARLGGKLSVAGTITRSEPEEHEASPSKGDPQFLVQLEATEADAPYWFYYFLDPIKGFKITRGRADAVITLASPPKLPYTAPEALKKQPLHLDVRAAVRFHQANVSTTLISQPITGADGTLSFADGTLLFDANAQVWNERVTANGELWNLTGEAPGAKTAPQFAVRIDAPRLPIQRVMREFVPQKPGLPKGLTVGGIARVRGSLSGPVSDPQKIVASAQVSGVDVAYAGYPSVQGLRGEIAYSAGLIQASNVTATVQGGGAVQGNLAYRALGDKTTIGNAVFNGRINNVDLSTITALKTLTENKDERMRLRGRGDVVATGRIVGEKLSAEANVIGQDLTVGTTRFPIARARVLVSGNRVILPSARVESEAGVLAVEGDVSPDGNVALKWRMRGLDLASLGKTLGVAGLDGLISASGSIFGTASYPEIRVDDLIALNLRYTQRSKEGQTQRYAIDLVTSEDIYLNPKVLTLNKPLMVYLFPASVTLTGTVFSPMPPTDKKSKFDPQLDLTARVENLDFQEILDQLANIAQPQTPADSPPVSGNIARATARITGKVSDPSITGTAALEDNIVIGPYPLEGGSVQFAYDKKSTRITEVVARVRSLPLPEGGRKSSAVKGSLTILPSGAINGQFRSGTYNQGQILSEGINIGRFSYLLGGAIRLEGEAKVSGAVSGTLKRPEVTAELDAPGVRVGGIALTELKGKGRFAMGEDGKPGAIQIENLVVAQAENRVEVRNASYNMDTGVVQANGGLAINNINGVVETLRRSDLTATTFGEKIVRALSQFPRDLTGKIALNEISVRGRIVDNALKESDISARIRGEGISLGNFETDTLAADVSVRDEVVTVTGLEAKTTTSTVRGSGTYDPRPNGKVQALLESNDFPLETLRLFKGLEAFPVTGSISFNISAEGESRAPRITVSIDGQNLTILTGRAVQETTAAATAASKGITLSTVSIFGGIEQSENGEYELYFPNISVTRGDALIRADARFPFAFDINDPSLPQRKFAVNLEIPKLNLANFADLLKVTEVALDKPETPPANLKAALTGKSKDGKTTQENSGDIAGTLAARVSMSGTLEQPKLSGLISLTDGKFRPAREPGGDRDLISPIQDLDLTLRLVGDKICFDKATFLKEQGDEVTYDASWYRDIPRTDGTILTLGGLNGSKGNFGNVTVTGSVGIKNLSNLQNFLRGTPRQRGRQAQQEQAIPIESEYNLSLAFKGLDIAAENLIAGAADVNKGDAFRCKLDGTLNITGDELLKPKIATPSGQPLLLKTVAFRVPAESKTASGPPPSAPFNPNFNIELRVTDKATLYNPVFFSFDVRGEAKLNGSLYDETALARNRERYLASLDSEGRPRDNDPFPQTENSFGFNLQGELNTLNGVILFPLARVTIQRAGIISINYGKDNADIRLNGVVGKASVGDTSNSLSNFRSYNSRDPLDSLPNLGSTSGNRRQTYKITISIDNMSLKLLALPTAGSANISDTSLLEGVTFSSDPYLDQKQIIALLLGQQQLAMASAGRVEDALRSFTAQALTSSLLPGQVSRITDAIAETLGLEELTVNYNLDGSAVISLQRRLGAPFDRFVVDVTRTFQTRNEPTLPQPYTFGLSYEVYQFGRRLRYQPRLQLGVSQDEQKTITTFVRGTVAF